MNVGRQVVWFALGFAAITLLGLFADPRPARAQSTSITTINPPPRAQEVQPRKGGLPTPYDPAADVPLRRGQNVAAPIPDDPQDEGNQEGEDGNSDGVPVQDRIGQRPTILDGDLLAADGIGPQEQDGVITTGEPRGPQDGADATINDTRSPDEIALFEDPPAGFDPRLFQAEIDPILDRRPERLFRFEPYDPSGIRIGNFVLLPEAEFGSSYFSNVLQTSKARADVTFDVRPTARLVSNWRMHALEFRATGAFSRFNEFSSEDDRAYTLESRGRIDLSKRTNFEALVSHDVTQDSPSSINAPAGATNRADITTDKFAAAFNHRFNRLSLQLRGSVAEVTYGPSEAAGSTIANNDRDMRTKEEAVRATWEFRPDLFTFVEAGLNQREYKTAAMSDGIRRDSTGDRYRAGVSFGNSGTRLRGEISGGYGTQRPDDARLKDISGFLIDANLAYRYSALTSFMFTARSDVTETTLANSAGAFSHQVGLEARHAFRRNLIGSAGISYSVQDYEGVDLQERQLQSTLGLEYYLNREVVLFGKYQHTALDSTDRSRNYNADEMRVGMRIRR